MTHSLNGKAVALLFGALLGGSALAQGMSRDGYGSTTPAGRDYQAAKARCDNMEGGARESCLKSARDAQVDAQRPGPADNCGRYSGAAFERCMEDARMRSTR